MEMKIYIVNFKIGGTEQFCTDVTAFTSRADAEQEVKKLVACGHSHFDIQELYLNINNHNEDLEEVENLLIQAMNKLASIRG